MWNHPLPRLSSQMESSSFRIVALPATPFAQLHELADEQLVRRGIRRMVADRVPGYPCRVSLIDAHVGDEVLLLPYEHQGSDSPFRASGPIFVRAGAEQATLKPGAVPDLVRHRMLSVRAYDRHGTMVGADIAEGRDVEQAITRFFADPQVEVLHLHNPARGCYLCRVERPG